MGRGLFAGVGQLPPQKIAKPRHGPHRHAIRFARQGRQRMIGAEDKGRAVNQMQVIAFAKLRAHLRLPNLFKKMFAMFRPALPVFALLVGPVFAQSAPNPASPNPAASWPCEVTEDETSCTRSFACFGDQGRWFAGRGIGRGTGVLDGMTSDGVTCEGVWTNSNAMGFGQADFDCADGTSGTVFYYLQDGYTGTATGAGKTKTGEQVEA